MTQLSLEAQLNLHKRYFEVHVLRYPGTVFTFLCLKNRIAGRYHHSTKFSTALYGTAKFSTAWYSTASTKFSTLKTWEKGYGWSTDRTAPHPLWAVVSRGAPAALTPQAAFWS